MANLERKIKLTDGCSKCVTYSGWGGHLKVHGLKDEVGGGRELNDLPTHQTKLRRERGRRREGGGGREEEERGRRRREGEEGGRREGGGE